MADVKIVFKSGFGDNAAGGALARIMTLQLNGEKVAGSDPKDARDIAKAFGTKNVAPHELKNGNRSLKGFAFDLKDSNEVVLVGKKGELSNKVQFGNGSKAKIVITKRGMLAKIFTGKFYAIKVKVK